MWSSGSRLQGNRGIETRNEQRSGGACDHGDETCKEEHLSEVGHSVDVGFRGYSEGEASGRESHQAET